MASRPRIQEKAIEVSPFALQWVRLEEDLDSEQGAQASRAFYVGNEWSPVSGQTITVYRPHADYSASADDVLPIYFNPVGRRYEIFQKSPEDEEETHYANLLWFTIQETTGGVMRQRTLNGRGMFATINDAIEGAYPPINGDGEIEIFDDYSMAPLAIRNCTGLAIRRNGLAEAANPALVATPRYQIVACDQMALQGRAILDGTLDGGFEVPIRNFQPDSEQPAGMMPIEPYISRAFNPHRRHAINGTPVLLRWGSAIFATPNPFDPTPQQGYVIEDVRRFEFQQPVDFRVNQSTKAIEIRWVPAAIETHIEDFANLPWSPMFPNKDC